MTKRRRWKTLERQDALGTPFCITVDHQTLEDETVTLSVIEILCNKIEMKFLNYAISLTMKFQ